MADAEPDIKTGGDPALTSGLKKAGLFLLDPKTLILETWNELVDQRIWEKATKRLALGCVIGAMLGISIVAILRFAGYDALFFIPTQMRLPQMLRLPAFSNAAWISAPYLSGDSIANVRAAGITYVDFKEFPSSKDDTLGYSAAENDRLQSLIAHAKTIDFLAYNAEGFTSNENVNNALKAFFSQSGVSMRVLLAKPDTDFYDDMATITNHLAKKGLFKLEVSKNEGLLSQLAGGDTSKIEFRLFNSQLRLPLIIIDKTYCLVTVRLPPDGSGRSIRLEIGPEDSGVGYVSHCLDHFDAIWNRAEAIQGSAS